MSLAWVAGAPKRKGKRHGAAKRVCVGKCPTVSHLARGRDVPSRMPNGTVGEGARALLAVRSVGGCCCYCPTPHPLTAGPPATDNSTCNRNSERRSVRAHPKAQKPKIHGHGKGRGETTYTPQDTIWLSFPCAHSASRQYRSASIGCDAVLSDFPNRAALSLLAGRTRRRNPPQSGEIRCPMSVAALGT